MSSQSYSVQKKTLFSKSLIWQLNRNFYTEEGMSVWSDAKVPHEITNSSLAATTYAELIYALLKDLESKNKTDDIVYILELGAGHGRLCYNILNHLENLISSNNGCSTKYCYVLSDIVEENLAFLSNHPQLKKYYEAGQLDIAYFDATVSQELILRQSNKTIANGELDQPILTIANYFFDSIPNELFHFHDKNMFSCSISIDSSIDPVGKSAQDLLGELEMTVHRSEALEPAYKNKIFNEILSQYIQLESDTYILFPKTALECLANISALSKTGLILLTMDKGFKEIQDLTNRAQPDFVTHGSFSLWVNFHALSEFCIKNGGHSFVDSSTNLSIELACLCFTDEPFEYHHLKQTYRKYSKQLNLDDLNSLKKMVYKNMATVNLSELLGLIRLNAYDASIFINALPRIKQLSNKISLKQRSRLKQTIHLVWDKYYAIKKDYDFSYELGGLMYDLGYYTEALDYFNCSLDIFGNKVDVNYNQILCYYQLRQDEMFYKTLEEAKLRFPLSEALLGLDKLDMG